MLADRNQACAGEVDRVKIKLIVMVLTLFLIAFAVGGCSGLSCSGGASATTTQSVATTLSTTTTTLAPTTTTFSTTTTSTTSTTLSALEAYRVAMKAWSDTYGPGLAQAYAALSGVSFTNPTPAQVQAIKDLDAAMGPMVGDLKAIQAPPDLAQAHADFAASLDKMAGGVHSLSQAMQQGQGLQALTAAAGVAAAWQQGAAARTTLEGALGFSLSG
jgi:hypothetical protein